MVAPQEREHQPQDEQEGQALGPGGGEPPPEGRYAAGGQVDPQKGGEDGDKEDDFQNFRPGFQQKLQGRFDQ